MSAADATMVSSTGEIWRDIIVIILIIFKCKSFVIFDEIGFVITNGSKCMLLHTGTVQHNPDSKQKKVLTVESAVISFEIKCFSYFQAKSLSNYGFTDNLNWIN